VEGHRRQGNFARYVTLFPNRFGFPEDICLRLPFHPDKNWIFQGKLLLLKLRGTSVHNELEGNPPIWKSNSFWEAKFFAFRDRLIERRVLRLMDDYGFWDYQIFHLEQGMEFFRDCRLILKLKSQGKHIVCFYHGTDIRNRGVFPVIHQISDLNLTSELDLMAKYPGIKYLFLPIDTEKVKPVSRENPKIKIAHSARSRFNKGSDFILRTVRELERDFPVELVFIENQPHSVCMDLKSKCDIYIDQLADRGGWGYGMSSIESLAQGLVTCTYMNPQCQEFFYDHPFVNVNYGNLKDELIKVIKDHEYREEVARRGREWVVKRHDIEAVMTQLYKYYEEAKII
jgi:glycosyltransferase involved in cell wall biosynthesis